MESENQDRFKNWMGVCIALVALVTALAAWRAAATSRAAAQEDYRAVVSVLKTQETQTLNFATALSHLTAFTEFVIHDEQLTRLLHRRAQTTVPGERAELQAQLEAVDKLAATNRNFFPGRYANQDGTFDLRRELAELNADAERRYDLEPDSHLASSAALDDKTFAFVRSIVILSVGLFCFTLAGALYAGHRILRWSSAALGLVLLALGTAIVVLTEMS